MNKKWTDGRDKDERQNGLKGTRCMCYIKSLTSSYRQKGALPYSLAVGMDGWVGG